MGRRESPEMKLPAAQIHELKMTRHAQARSQQRAIPKDLINAVLDVGAEYEAGGRCMAYWVSDSVVRRQAMLGKHVPERARGVAVVVAEDGGVVTVQRVPRPKRCWRSTGRL